MAKVIEKKAVEVRNTTNYAMDSHKAFCKRCFKFHKGCPSTGTKNKSESCKL